MAPDLDRCLGPNVLCEAQDTLFMTSFGGIGTRKILGEDKAVPFAKGLNGTFYASPSPAVHPQGLQEAPVLMVGPLLSLLSDGVGLAGLRHISKGISAVWKKSHEHREVRADQTSAEDWASSSGATVLREVPLSRWHLCLSF